MSEAAVRQPVRVLVVEDDDDDLLLVLQSLRDGGFQPDYRQVTTAEALEAALTTQPWDAVICDHNLPQLDSTRAMALVKQIAPLLPFVIVSGAFGEVAGAEAIRSGASDVVGKDKLLRLAPVLQRELREARVKRDLLQSRRQLEQLAYYDAQTGLPNLHRFLQEVDCRCEAGAVCAVGVIKLRRFRQLQRLLGPQRSERMLVALAERLKQDLGRDYYLARVEHERFAILCPELSQQAELSQRARTLVQGLPQAFEFEGLQLDLAWAIGASQYPDHGLNAEQLYRNAKLALRSALRGRGGCELFDPSGNGAADLEEDLLDALHRALQNQEFFLEYQPQVVLNGGNPIAAEALLRWRHPARGTVSPGEFIPLLEESGLIVAVGEWVLRTACRQAAAWHAAGHVLRVAVNLSVAQFEQSGLVACVAAALDEAGLPAAALELEVTESIAMNDRAQVVATLQQLRDLGVALAVDDFGTGYSSLNYLKHFPVDKLKIDQSFVRGITTDPRDGAIVCAVIGMARALGLEVVAEGVETAAQAAFLRAHECHQGQGWHFGRPSAPENLLARLSELPVVH